MAVMSEGREGGNIRVIGIKPVIAEENLPRRNQQATV